MIRAVWKTLPLLLLAAPSAEGKAFTLRLRPDSSRLRDTWISSSLPLASPGDADTLLVGSAGLEDVPIDVPQGKSSPNKTRVAPESRALLRFPLPPLPADGSVTGSSLRLFVRKIRQTGSMTAMTVGAYRVTSDWAEGSGGELTGATWRYRDPPLLWATPGGDHDNEQDAESLGVAPAWFAWDVTPVTQSWAADSTGNRGMLLRRKSGGFALASIVSGDHADVSLRPTLVVTYESAIADTLAAVEGGVAEIQPAEVDAATTDTLTLYALLTLGGDFTAQGPNSIFIPLPEGYADPAALDVTVDGSAVVWSDASGPDSLAVDLESRILHDAALAVRFSVTTPATPDTTGKDFVPHVDDAETAYLAQALAEGDGNGVGGDGDTYRVRVRWGDLATIEVTPADPEITADSSLAFTATGRDSTGTEVPLSPSWAVRGGVGTIDEGGLFDGTTAGAGWVVASEGAIAGSTTVTVRHGVVASLAVSPADTTIPTSGSVSYTAAATDGDGNPFLPEVKWWTTPEIGKIGQDGLYTPRIEGAGIVVAKADAVSDTASITVHDNAIAAIVVKPASAAVTTDSLLPFAAEVLDEEGSPVDTIPLWRIEGGIGTIGDNGLFDPTAVGSGLVIPYLGDVEDTALVTVTHGAAVRLEIGPRDSTLTALDSALFHGLAYDADSNSFSPEAISWSEPSGLGSIDATGLYRASGAGDARIAGAAPPSLADTAALTVLPGPVATIPILPADLSIFTGEETLFAAVPIDGKGNTTGDVVSWDIDGTIGTIDGGLFTATTAGAGGVVASAGDVSDTAAVTVYDDLGLSLDEVIESRETVTAGEENISVSLRVSNHTGDTVTGLGGSLRFLLAGEDRSTEYAVSALPHAGDLPPDGGADTLRFLVAVGDTATTGVSVTVDGAVSGTLQANGTPAAALAAIAKGEWSVGGAPLLLDVSRSLFPSSAHAGNEVGFHIAVKNLGETPVRLDGGCELSFTGGGETYEALIEAPVDVPTGGAPAACIFAGTTIPSAFDPGTYTISLDLGGEDGNGGSFHTILQAGGNPLDLFPPYIVAVANPIDPVVVYPDADSIPLLRLRLTNLYDTARTLASIRIQNGNSGPGSTGERDAEWEIVHLVRDEDDDGAWDGGEALLGTGVFSGGSLLFGSLAVPIGPADSTALLVAGDLDRHAARDGEEIDAFVASATDLAFEEAADVYASFPLDSPGSHFIDGLVASQLEAAGPFPPDLPAGADDSLALEIRVPSNGYEPDTLRALTLRNGGTALAGTDITEARLWLDGGNGMYDRSGADDTNLGELYWAGDGWTRSGIDLPLPAGGVRLFASVDASEDPVGQRTIRLEVPIDGIAVASSNDGPIDTVASSPTLRVLGGVEQIVAGEAAGAGGEAALPGDEDRLLLEFALTSFYADTVRLVSLAVDNGSSGAAPDSALPLMHLHEGALLTGGGGETPAPLASAPSANGAAWLTGFSAAVPPGGTIHMTIGADVGLRCVADGETLRVSLGGAAAFGFDTARSVTGVFPLAAPGGPVVDGQAAAQVIVHAVEGGALTPAESGRLALAITIPANGCLADTLLGVRLVNNGTATPSDIDRLVLYGGAGEVEIGDLVWNGQAWMREGIARSVGAGGETLRVRAGASADADDGRTIELCVPIGGLAVASENDGPVDEPVCAGAILTIATSPLFAALELPAGPVSAGQEYDVSLVVQNVSADTDTLSGARPDSFGVTGAATTILSSPAGEGVLLAPGEETRFTWVCRSGDAGIPLFSAAAAAERKAGGEPLVSPLVAREGPRVETPPAALSASPVSTLPLSVERGEPLVPLLVLPLAHADSAGGDAASIRVDTLRISFEDREGDALAPVQFLRGAAAEVGGSAVGVVDSASIDSSLLVIPLVPPLVIGAGDGRVVEIFVDVRAATEVESFAGVLEEADAATARDANSGMPVPLAGPFPFQTQAASIVLPPASLSVTVTEGLPPRINRGTSFVPIVRFELESEGIPGVTADLSIHTVRLVLTDSRFPFHWARVSGPGIIHFSGAAWDREGAIVAFPLEPPVVVPVNNRIEVSLVGHLDAAAPLGALRFGVDDSLFIDPRIETGDTGVDIELLLTEPIETVVVVPTDSISATGSGPADTSVATPGERGRGVFRILFRHGGADTLSAVEIAGLSAGVETEAGDSVSVRSLFSELSATFAGEEIAAVAPLDEERATVAIPFGETIHLDPGDSAEVRFAADLRADAPPGDYRFVVRAAAVDLSDANGGGGVSLRFDDGDPERFVSNSLPVRQVSERASARIDLTLPPTVVGDAAIEEAGTIRLASPGGETMAGLHVTGLVVSVDGPDGAPIDPSRVIGGGSISVVGSAETFAPSPADSSILFLFEPPLEAAPGETLTLSLGLVVAAAPEEDAFRIRIDAGGITLAEEGTSVERAENDGGANPSAYTHLAERSFATSLRNYPNPFAAGEEKTILAFYARGPGEAEIRLFTGLGIAVRSWRLHLGGAGLVETEWDGRNGDGHAVLSGAYLAAVAVRYDDGTSEDGMHKIAVLH